MQKALSGQYEALSNKVKEECESVVYHSGKNAPTDGEAPSRGQEAAYNRPLPPSPPNANMRDLPSFSEAEPDDGVSYDV